jgi:2-keto-4-pentenoate hydratase/2-oxohepta-3-ene-1,7-dioic acid hydratase in catechol pathway
MRLARIGVRGAEVPVVLDGQGYLDLRSLTADVDGAFLADQGLARVADALERGLLDPIEVPPGVRVGAPIAWPSAIYAVGMNYAAHAAESGTEPPSEPIVFLKPPNTLGGPNDDVRIPRRSERTDWEVELGVVIGSRASYLDTPTDAMEVVAGFVVANDLSERSWQLVDSGGQWSTGTSAPGFCPVGPWLVTPDEIPYPDVRLRSWVNGEPRQDSTTGDLVYGVEFLVWYLSQYLVLEPGDLILTGTPEGVALSGRFPYLRSGDVVECEIDGLGRQRQRFVRAG